jgi:16S rRNA (cytosine967-C5)-methyltransferase
MKISPARKATFDILQKIEKENAFSSILLPQFEDRLPLKERALCHQLTLGVLRKKIYLDRLIKNLTQKKLEKFDIEILNALRIGIYQLKFLDKIPDYSAINESVNLVKYARKKSAAGLVNAVLRKVAKREVNLTFQNEIEELSIISSHPIWLINKWIDQFGFEKTKKIAFSNNEIAPLSFRFTNRFFSRTEGEKEPFYEKIAEQKSITKSRFLKNSFISATFNKLVKELAEENLIYFQDPGSQIVANSVDLIEGERFLDLCAAPGSKTTQIATSLLKEKINKKVFAGDLYHHRLATLKKNCSNQKVSNVDFIRYDAEKELPFGAKSFDKILVDAPCSGTGTIRHNPEIRYSLHPTDFSELQNKQLKILIKASELIKPGGCLIYSTCSLEEEENEKVVDLFLESNKEFQKGFFNLENELLNRDGFVRTFPHQNQTDGFFIAKLARK